MEDIMVEWVERLVKLGRERTIPPLFERAWMSERGGNPVAAAICIVENKRRDKNRTSLAVAALALFIALCFSVADILSYKGGGVAIDVFSWLQDVFILLALLGIFIALEKKGQGMFDGAISATNSFCGHLALVSQWLGYPSYLAPELTYSDEDALKRVGSNILVTAADSVLRLQKQEKEAESPKMKEQWQVSAGNEMSEFTLRYNTLQRIGLASGGYTKYFEKAAQRIAEAKQ